MTKAEIFKQINDGKATLTGSVRTEDRRVQLDKWKTKDGKEYIITSMGRLRADRELRYNPDYQNERLQLLTLID